VEERGIKAAAVIHPTRMAISGKTKGAGLFEIMEVLGKEKVINRMKGLKR
jgi:glutamyl-tRNA synthetase